MGRKSIAHETQHAFDLYANAYTVIQEQHRMAHDGFMFHSAGVSLDLADAGTFEILLVTPANTYPHIQKIKFFLEDSPATIELFEGVTASADGAADNTQNVNRNSPLTPGSVVTTGPTVTDDGTLLTTKLLSGTGKDSGQIGDTLGEEWILKPSTKYLVRLTNLSAGIIDLSWELSFYEIGADSEGP